MSYFPAYIDASGLHIPAYEDILADMIAQFKGLYGQNVYLGNDSADYQWISTVALKLSDTMQAMQIVYNNRGPSTAVGAGLDGIVKLNGIARKLPGNSNVLLTCIGLAGTVVNGGVAQDNNGFLWNLASPFTIPISGNIVINAICQQPGAVSADPNTITIIATPTAGWTSVSNASAAIPGEPTESDSLLRARQALSVSLPSQTRLQATSAGIAATANVTRWNVLENPTGAPDLYGTPAHSISAIVEGGTDADVAMAIYLNRSIGCYTNGSTTVVVTDPVSGFTTPIRFSRPIYIPVQVNIFVHPINVSSAIIGQVQAQAVAYLNSLQIGEILTVSGLIAYIMELTSDLDNPTFSLRQVLIGYASLITSVTLSAAGTGYHLGDELVIDQTGSTNMARVFVSAIGSGGAITGITLAQTATGYTTATNVPTIYPVGVTGTGTGASVNIGVSSTLGTTDIAMAYFQVTQGITANVAVAQV